MVRAGSSPPMASTAKCRAPWQPRELDQRDCCFALLLQASKFFRAASDSDDEETDNEQSGGEEEEESGDESSSSSSSSGSSSSDSDSDSDSDSSSDSDSDESGDGANKCVRDLSTSGASGGTLGTLNHAACWEGGMLQEYVGSMLDALGCGTVQVLGRVGQRFG